MESDDYEGPPRRHDHVPRRRPTRTRDMAADAEAQRHAIDGDSKNKSVALPTDTAGMCCPPRKAAPPPSEDAPIGPVGPRAQKKHGSLVLFCLTPTRGPGYDWGRSFRRTPLMKTLVLAVAALLTVSRAFAAPDSHFDGRDGLAGPSASDGPAAATPKSESVDARYGGVLKAGDAASRLGRGERGRQHR